MDISWLYGYIEEQHRGCMVYHLAHMKNVYTDNSCSHPSVSVHLTKGACLLSLYQSPLQYAVVAVHLLVRHCTYPVINKTHLKIICDETEGRKKLMFFFQGQI